MEHVGGLQPDSTNRRPGGFLVGQVAPPGVSHDSSRHLCDILKLLYDPLGNVLILINANLQPDRH